MKNINLVYFFGIVISFYAINSAQDQTDLVKRIATIRTMDAHVRQFLDKIENIKSTASALNDQYNCVKKDRDLAKCSKIGCSTTKECLHMIFSQFQKILDPIMLNLVGTIKTGELKPGAITALPLLWSEPRPDKVKSMQDILVNNIALNFNDIYNFFGLMSKSLDPNLTFEEKKDTVPVAVQDPAQPTPAEQPKKKKRKKKKKTAAEQSASTESTTQSQPETPAPTTTK